jgi:topoisomerase-4 subunit A
MELRKELDALTEEKAQIEGLLGSDDKQWKTVAWDIRQVRKTFGPETAIGKRRTQFAEAPETLDIDLNEAMVEREPITVVVSRKGWIRALKGHVQDLASLTWKGDDSLKFSFFTETTARVLVICDNGKVFTLDASKLPGGRGFGDPIRLSIDLEESADFIAAFPFKAGVKLLFASSDGRGFIAPADDIVANTRKGKQVMNLDDGLTCVFALAVSGDHIAVIGENRKLLCFPLAQVPEMGRGKGVRLQKYKDGGLADATTLKLADGLSWKLQGDSNRTRTEADLTPWLLSRAAAGRLPPQGFPKDNRFQ